MKNAKTALLAAAAMILMIFTGCGDNGASNIANYGGGYSVSVSDTDADKDIDVNERLYVAIRQYGESIGLKYDPQSTGTLLSSSGGSAVYYFDGSLYYYADEKKTEKASVTDDDLYNVYYKLACDRLDKLKSDGATAFGFNFDYGDPDADGNLLYIDVNGYK